jgi:hypothetical protein
VRCAIPATNEKLWIEVRGPHKNLSFGLVKYKHFWGFIEKRVDHREEILTERKDRKLYF